MTFMLILNKGQKCYISVTEGHKDEHLMQRRAHVQALGRHPQAQESAAGRLQVGRKGARQLHDSAVDARGVARVVWHGFKCC